MAGKILTPVTLWENFRILSTDFKVLNTVTKNGVTFVDLYVYRPISRTEKVAIYTKLAYNTPSFSDKPTIFLLQDICQKINDDDLSFIVSRGYSVVAMDIAGGDELLDDNALGERNPVDVLYTIYPKSIFYANYKNAIPVLLNIKEDKTARDNPYYQWAVNARYVINYLRTVEKITKLGVIAVKDAVTIGFHVAATAKLDAFVSLYGCGWQLPIGFKFSTKVRTEYDGQEHRFLAGIEAQSYAS